MPWGDLIKNELTFYFTNMLIPYKGGVSKQYLQKMAKNTGYNWRHSDKTLFLLNENFPAEGERDYDTDRNYIGSYLRIWVIFTESPLTLPYHWPDPGNSGVWYEPILIQLTTSYQIFYGAWQRIKALASGGFRIHSGAVGTQYLSGVIEECRLVVGVLVE